MIDLHEALRFEYAADGHIRTGALRPARVRRLLHRLRGRRVAVVGDLILDEFLWGDATRISPEAPVPVVLLTRESWSLGGAGNVAANVHALGGRAALFGTLGEDAAGRRLQQLVAAVGIDAADVVALPERPTTVKQRVLAQNKHVLRIDREITAALPEAAARRVLRRLAARLDEFGAVVLSDYGKGGVTAALARGLARLCAEHHVPLCIDPKVHGFPYPGASVLKPNLRELSHLAGFAVESETQLERAVARIFRQHRPQHLLITRGSQGMLLCEAAGGRTRLFAGSQSVSDVTGAGDTAIATLGLAMAAGIALREAAILANLAAGVVVTKPGTATATPQEILQALPGEA
ncbi:MAG: bifunctional heptose 7-phosphate kinase/heptose 1-phosphate adenyltransferase [Terriglobales bacterium]